MAIELIRRIAVLLMAVALIFGPAVGGAYAASMDATIASVASADMHSSGMCGPCGTTKAGIPASSYLSAACCSLTAFPTNGNVVFNAPAESVLAKSDDHHMSGRADAPDPYPPRTTEII